MALIHLLSLNYPHHTDTIRLYSEKRGEKLMKKLPLLFIVIFILSCAARPTAPPEPQEPKISLSGTWREIRNQNRPVRGKKTWTFSGDTITINDGEDTYSGTFTYNEEADPQEIDLYFDGFPTNKAIYGIRGNRLMIKLLDTATKRPTELRFEKGYILVTCYREKDEGPDEEPKE